MPASLPATLLALQQQQKKVRGRGRVCTIVRGTACSICHVCDNAIFLLSVRKHISASRPLNMLGKQTESKKL